MDTYRLFLFLIVLGTFHLPVSAQSTNSLFLRAAIQKLEHARAYTLQVAEAMPSEHYMFKPTEESMTFAQQLHHLAENLGWLSSVYLKNETNPVTKKLQSDKNASIHELELVYDYALLALQAFPPQSLPDTVSFFAGPMTKLQIINLINDHQTHHRAQLAVYLRMVGVKPPAYIGW